MMLGAKSVSAPFRIHDTALEHVRKCYIIYPRMARSAFAPDIIMIKASKVITGLFRASRSGTNLFVPKTRRGKRIYQHFPKSYVSILTY